MITTMHACAWQRSSLQQKESDHAGSGVHGETALRPFLLAQAYTGVRGERWGSPEEKKAEMLTGTWLESAKVLAGLFFLLLLLFVLPPPELMVLPPDIFRFLRLLGCCRAGSAVPEREKTQVGEGPGSPLSIPTPQKPAFTLFSVLESQE